MIIDLRRILLYVSLDDRNIDTFSCDQTGPGCGPGERSVIDTCHSVNIDTFSWRALVSVLELLQWIYMQIDILNSMKVDLKILR